MSLCPEQLSGYALNTLQNLGSPPGISIPYVVMWYSNSGNLAKINNALGVCAAITGQGCIVGLDDDAWAIYNLIYNQQYFSQGQASLYTSMFCGGTNALWTNLAEGDSRIARESPANMQRSLNQTIAQNDKQLRLAIGDWKRNHSFPTTVDATSLASYPTP